MTESLTPSISKQVIDFCIDPTDLTKLDLEPKECRQILPFLTRLWIRNSTCIDDPEYKCFKLAILDKLRTFEDTNRICDYLNVDFTQIYEDVIRHLSARFKLFYNHLLFLYFIYLNFNPKEKNPRP